MTEFQFEDIYELLESVRAHELRPKESLVPLNSRYGTVIGYTVADTEGATDTWSIPIKLAKASALARGTRESVQIADLLTSYMGRKQLLEQLRDGTLDYGISKMANPPSDAPSFEETSKVFVPRQCFLPGL